MKGPSKELRPGLWRLVRRGPWHGPGLSIATSSPSPEGFCLVDAGPAALGAGALSSRRRPSRPGQISEPYAPSSSWTTAPSPIRPSASGMAAGFGGEVVADWRVSRGPEDGRYLSAAFPGASSDTDDGGLPGRGRGTRAWSQGPRAPAARSALFHAPSGLLFSGRLGFLGLGKRTARDLRPTPSLPAQSQLHGRDTATAPDSISRGEDLPSPGRSSRAFCPRFGSLVPEDLSSSPPSSPLASSPARAGPAPSPREELLPLMRELDTLKSSNYVLKEAMIVASDSALRDPASQLYGRELRRRLRPRALRATAERLRRPHSSA